MNKLLPGFLAVLCFASCNKEIIRGRGAIVTETRNLTGFTRIVTNGSTNVHVTQGSSFSVQIHGYENLLPYLQTKLNGNALEIGYRDVALVRNDNVEAFVTMPSLEGINVSGSAGVDVNGPFAGSDINATISGSGSVSIFSGSTPNFSSNISGSGDVHAFGLDAKNVDVTVSGSGKTEVRATDKLKVRISGSGSVYYKGQPVVESSVSGSGRLVHQ